jgi:N-acetylglucosamine kinase-like BadF-type ATPase
MRYVLGLDGGGTKTVAVLADETGTILGYGRGGPMNISFVPLEAARQSVADAILGAIREAGAAMTVVDLACVGSAGPVDLIRPDQVLPVELWHVAYEHGLCLASALQAGDAVVILAGTGCFQYGRGPLGQHRADGRGALCGDEGSAYWIAREALVAVGRAADKRGPDTALTQAFLTHMGVSDVPGLTRKLYADGGLPRHEIAAMARVVTGAAAGGDAIAAGVCREAARRLAHGALVCARETGLLDREFPVVLCGGVLSAGEVILQPLREAVLAGAPGARFVHPQYEPAVGGVLAALQHLGIPWTPELLENLDRTLETRKRRSDG